MESCHVTTVLGFSRLDDTPKLKKIIFVTDPGAHFILGKHQE